MAQEAKTDLSEIIESMVAIAEQTNEIVKANGQIDVGVETEAAQGLERTFYPFVLFEDRSLFISESTKNYDITPVMVTYMAKLLATNGPRLQRMGISADLAVNQLHTIKTINNKIEYVAKLEKTLYEREGIAFSRFSVNRDLQVRYHFEESTVDNNRSLCITNKTASVEASPFPERWLPAQLWIDLGIRIKLEEWYQKNIAVLSKYTMSTPENERILPDNGQKIMEGVRDYAHGLYADVVIGTHLYPWIVYVNEWRSYLAHVVTHRELHGVEMDLANYYPKNALDAVTADQVDRHQHPEFNPSVSFKDAFSWLPTFLRPTRPYNKPVICQLTTSVYALSDMLTRKKFHLTNWSISDLKNVLAAHQVSYQLGLLDPIGESRPLPAKFSTAVQPILSLINGRDIQNVGGIRIKECKDVLLQVFGATGTLEKAIPVLAIARMYNQFSTNHALPRHGSNLAGYTNTILNSKQLAKNYQTSSSGQTHRFDNYEGTQKSIRHNEFVETNISILYIMTHAMNYLYTGKFILEECSYIVAPIFPQLMYYTHSLLVPTFSANLRRNISFAGSSMSEVARKGASALNMAGLLQPFIMLGKLLPAYRAFLNGPKKGILNKTMLHPGKDYFLHTTKRLLASSGVYSSVALSMLTGLSMTPEELEVCNQNNSDALPATNSLIGYMCATSNNFKRNAFHVSRIDDIPNVELRAMLLKMVQEPESTVETNVLTKVLGTISSTSNLRIGKYTRILNSETATAAQASAAVKAIQVAAKKAYKKNEEKKARDEIDVSSMGYDQGEYLLASVVYDAIDLESDQKGDDVTDRIFDSSIIENVKTVDPATKNVTENDIVTTQRTAEILHEKLDLISPSTMGPTGIGGDEPEPPSDLESHHSGDSNDSASEHSGSDNESSGSHHSGGSNRGTTHRREPHRASKSAKSQRKTKRHGGK